MTNTLDTPSLVLENDYIRASDDFGTDPADVLALARETALVGTGAAPSALVPAADLAEELTDDHIPEIREAFLNTLHDGESPHNFLYTLGVVDALDVGFPQLAALDSVPAGPDEYHQEGNALRHTLLVMENYHKISPNDVTGLLGALAHDLGKAETPEDEHPHHYGHDKEGIEPARNLAAHLDLSEYETAMTQAAENHMRMAYLPEMRHSKIIRLVEAVEEPGGYGIERLLNLLDADGLGRIPQTETNREPFRERIDTAFRVIDEIDADTIREKHPDMDEEDVDGQVLSERTHRFGHYLDTADA
jgi:tRNA nucleotidyltransferase (CCA-adding enzyme)